MNNRTPGGFAHLRLAATFALLISSCAANNLTPAGEKVRLTRNPDVVKGCTFIKNVSVHPGDITTTWGGHADSGAMEKRDNELRNEASKAGGDTVVEVTAEGTYASGEVYRCGDKPQQ